MADDRLKPEDIPVHNDRDGKDKAGGAAVAGQAENAGRPRAGGLLSRITGAPLNAVKKAFRQIKNTLRLPSAFHFLREKKKPIIIGLSTAVILATATLSFHLGTRYSDSDLNPFNKKGLAQKGSICKTKPFLILVQEKEPDAFLRVEIDLVSENSKTASEIKEKERILREVIYTFLISREPESLRKGIKDKRLRMELAEYINKYLAKGKISDVVFARCGYI